MKNLFYLALVSILASIVLSACKDAEESSGVNQDRIYTIYDLIYNGNKDVTYARATFRFGNDQGTLLKLTSPSEVSFEGDLLTYTNDPITNFTYYEKEYAGYKDHGKFSWTDYDGKTFGNDITTTVINYPDTVADVSKGSSYEMFWKGDPLTANESVVLTLNNIDTVALDAQVSVQNDLNSTSVIITKNKLDKLPAGNGEFIMERIYNPGLTQKTGAGGVIRGTYRPENVKVQIK